MLKMLVLGLLAVQGNARFGVTCGCTSASLGTLPKLSEVLEVSAEHSESRWCLTAFPGSSQALLSRGWVMPETIGGVSHVEATARKSGLRLSVAVFSWINPHDLLASAGSASVGSLLPALALSALSVHSCTIPSCSGSRILRTCTPMLFVSSS
jgi:hypothetical protein